MTVLLGEGEGKWDIGGTKVIYGNLALRLLKLSLLVA